MMELLVFARLCGSAGLEQKKVGGRRKASTALRLLEDGTTGQNIHTQGVVTCGGRNLSNFQNDPR